MCSLKPPSPVPSSAYMMSLTVKFCAVVPASALVTAEIPGVIALLASLIPSSVGERVGLVSSCPCGPAALLWA